MTVLLVNPTSPRGWVANREGFGGLGVATPGKKGFVYPSLRLAEAAGWLRNRGRRVVVLDYVLATLRSAARAALVRPRAVIMQAAARTLDHDLREAARLKARHRCLLVVTGVGLEPHRATVEERVPGALLSAGPTGFEAALLALGEEADPGPPDTWPDARWSRLSLGRSRRLALYHGRGCFHACSYCPYRLATNGTHVVRSAGRTFDEFVAQVERWRPRRVVFRDPTFGLARGSTVDLLQRLAGRRVRTPFEVETRPELLDVGMLDALAEAGCVEIKLGVETFEAAPLIASGRVLDHATAQAYRLLVENVLAECRRRELTVRGFVLSGLAEATADGDRETDAALAGVPLVHRKELVPPDAVALARETS